MNDCEHATTQVRTDRDGLFCGVCNAKVYGFETRECQYCANFRVGGTEANCLKKKQFVFRTMHVLFSVEDGTCFE